MADTTSSEAPKTENVLPLLEKKDDEASAAPPAEAAAKPQEEPAEKAADSAQLAELAPADGEPSGTTAEPAADPAPAAAAETPAEKQEAAAPAAAAPAPAAETPSAEKAPATSKPPSAIAQFAEKLPSILSEVGHDEMWGVTLKTLDDVPTSIVLQKFLNANEGDLAKAVEQFTGALKFRKEKKPLELLAKTFSQAKFGTLGAVTSYKAEGGGVPVVFTWNLYGNVKDRMDEVFVPLEEFMDYRIALQELGIKQLNLPGATEPISETKDPYKIVQVHDYKSVSFFRQNPNVRAASTEVIKKFALAYPELLKEKFFVNVPAIMGWMYAFIKLFVAEKTAKKFHPMANGANLAAEFRGRAGFDAKELPKEYGGEGGSGDVALKGVPGSVDELKFE
ncbi:Phosphatidylinositol transfer protein SFH5 [Pleurostoma richardsiae]|uniref:Phosphatidylinositol transfer protein SFH5 n=1 Tax=Pleurostoma richardsiae TaxID=41990 RepID=A0AA38VLC9_9PEZI|nr:Phosphatidylinositol transfer protein SFH5 [Pleurostoma richardsiae]